VTYSLRLSFAAPDAVEMKGKRLGEFAKEARLSAEAKTNGHGVIYRLKTFFFCTSQCENTVVARHC